MRVGRNGHSLTREYRAVLMLDPCVYCGRPAQGLDHILSKSTGGPDGWRNRAPACRTCDELKGPVGPLTFLAARRLAAVKAARRRYQNPNHRIAAERAMVMAACRAEHNQPLVVHHTLLGKRDRLVQAIESPLCKSTQNKQ